MATPLTESYIRCTLPAEAEQCRALWQSRRQAVALNAARDELDAAAARIAALEDDNRRLRRLLGVERPALALVADQAEQEA